MELDASCLRWAKVENLERLARAVRVPLPIHKRHNRDTYHRTLVRLIAREIPKGRVVPFRSGLLRYTREGTRGFVERT